MVTRNSRREASTTILTATPVDVSSSSSSSCTIPSSQQQIQLLRDWIHHSDSSHHHFCPEKATEIRHALLEWYRMHRRKLPWRGDPPPYDGSTAGINHTKNGKKNKKTDSKQQSSITSFFQTDPPITTSTSSITAQPDTTTSSAPEVTPVVSAYGIWVSEIMLQQTRVEAVIPYWLKWMEAFPTVDALAQATEEQVNAHWAGLGFYRRARFLHQGAKYVMAINSNSEETRKDVDGLSLLPKTREGLLRIPGVGPYTASAIASIAFDVCTPVVDGNVCRVLSRLTGIANHIKAPILTDHRATRIGGCWQLAQQIVQAGDGTCAGEVNQALMELGATYCAPSGTGIDPRDPLKNYYVSTGLGRGYRHMLLSQQEQNEPNGENGAMAATMTDAILHSSSSSDDGSASCEWCNYPDGIHTVLERLRSTITVDSTDDEAAQAGHAVFPLEPPKLKKREEDLAMAVIVHRKDQDDEASLWWLLIRRPDQGLLAGQWEFPNTCVQIRNNSTTAKSASTSKKKGQRPKKATTNKPPSATARQKALTAFLTEISAPIDDDWIASTSRDGMQPSPIEHIFSHVKHFMWVETGVVTGEIVDSPLEWTTDTGLSVRWMQEEDMKRVGITSGVKKVLKAAKEHLGITTKTKKRKR